MKILWNGPTRYPDSYSSSARDMLVELYRRGVRVKTIQHALPLWEGYPFALPEETAHILDVANAERFDSRDTVMFQFCVPGSFLYEPNVVANIGYTMFETNRIPMHWVVPCMSQDEIWTPSRWGAETFRSTGLAKQKLRVLPIGYNDEVFKVTDERLDIPELDGKKVFGCCFDWTPRKNGLQTVAGFLKAFEGRDDVVLLLKCYFKHPLDSSRAYFKEQIKRVRDEANVHGKPDILVYPEILPDWEMGKFYNSLDFHVSLSHGEGFNKPILEAMACGVPSIATMWSGHLEFCNVDNSILVSDCPIGPVEPQQVQMCGATYEGSAWAMPSLVNIQENFRYADQLPDEVLAQLQQNCLATAANYTRGRMVDRFLNMLGEIRCKSDGS